jgi:general stress protein 26
MLVILQLDAKNADQGQVAVEATEVTCVSQWESSVHIFFKGDDDPVIISHSTTAEVVAILQPRP